MASAERVAAGARPLDDSGAHFVSSLSNVAAWTLVTLLFVAYVFSFIDRIILGFLTEPIKAEYAVSDTQIGLLQGLAFALFYTICGLPIGWLVDRWPRIPIAAAGVALWSAMTAICGLTQNFGQLFAARAGVGVGEATLSPAAYSLISDAFPPDKLGRAFSLYNLGSSMGGGLAFIVGGIVVTFATTGAGVALPLVGPIEGWRLAFLIVGVPGVILAILLALFPEPARSRAAGMAPQPPITTTIAFWMRARGFFTPLHLAMAIINAVLFGTVSWIAPYLIRAHGMPLGTVGWTVGLSLIVGGLVGTLGGGLAGDRASKRAGTAGRMRSSALLILISAPAFALLPICSGSAILLPLALVCAFAPLMTPLGNASAALQERTPPRMRGLIAAFYFFVLNLLGITFGPLIIAGLADLFFSGRPDGIGLGMAIALPPLVLAASVLFWVAGRAVETPERISAIGLSVSTA